MSVLIKEFSRNTQGRDFIVGDIHGHFTRLQEALNSIGFDSTKDRLFSVGDLVDRGPESHLALEWIARPWFHAVQGNHEDMAIRYPNGRMDRHNYSANGGGWNIANPPNISRSISIALQALPVAIEIETTSGIVGVVHADCPLPTWAEFSVALKKGIDDLVSLAVWSRNRINTGNSSGVPDIRAVVVGHTPLASPVLLGNVFHIDTAGWHPSGVGFTFLNAETLELTTVPKTGESNA